MKVCLYRRPPGLRQEVVELLHEPLHFVGGNRTEDLAKGGICEMDQMLIANRPAAAYVVVRATFVGLYLDSQRLLDATTPVSRKYNLSTADMAVLPQTATSVDLSEPCLGRLWRVLSRYERVVAARLARQSDASTV